MQGASEARTLPCEALGKIPLHGRILAVSVDQITGVEVEINYLADWDHAFFGIADGMVTTIRLATVTPDEDGQFDVELPDFFKQTNLGKGYFQFMLRCMATRNIVAMLQPENTPRFAGLDIRSSYAPFVLFSADRSISTPPPIHFRDRRTTDKDRTCYAFPGWMTALRRELPFQTEPVRKSEFWTYRRPYTLNVRNWREVASTNE
jgi:hypothetical protein